MAIKFPLSQTRPHLFSASDGSCYYLSRASCILHVHFTLCEIDGTLSGIMLGSVQIVCTCRIQKQWGLHEVSDTGTLSELYMAIVAGTLASGSSFDMPVELNDQTFSCEIGNSQNGSFQQCPTNLKANDAKEFAGKYVRFRIESSETQRSAQGVTRSGVHDPICIHCGADDDFISGEQAKALYPTCSACFSTKPEAFRRKIYLTASSRPLGKKK